MIVEAKRLNEARLEPMREFRRLAESLLSNPFTTPEDIAWIEQRQRDVQTLLEANKAVERQLADRHADGKQHIRQVVVIAQREPEQQIGRAHV